MCQGSKVSSPELHFVTLDTTYTDDNRKIKRIRVVDKANADKALTYAEFLVKIQTSPDFLDDFADVLRRGLQSFSDMDMTPYFFETPPVTSDTLETTDFEFVLIAAREFLRASTEAG
jgi:hypothetical protein